MQVDTLKEEGNKKGNEILKMAKLKVQFLEVNYWSQGSMLGTEAGNDVNSECMSKWKQAVWEGLLTPWADWEG